MRPKPDEWEATSAPLLEAGRKLATPERFGREVLVLWNDVEDDEAAL